MLSLNTTSETLIHLCSSINMYPIPVISIFHHHLPIKRALDRKSGKWDNKKQCNMQKGEKRRIMRVITGIARGVRLETLPGNDTRPTAERVKEALFSALQFELEGRRALDLFAGSGQLGIEALSRGAASCTFVDRSTAAVEIIRRNLRKAVLDTHSQVLCQDAAAYLARTPDRFDILFLDPPYASGVLPTILPMAAAVTDAGGVIACETDARQEMPNSIADFLLYRSYRYGKTFIHLYRASGV